MSNIAERIVLDNIVGLGELSIKERCVYVALCTVLHTPLTCGFQIELVATK